MKDATTQIVSLTNIFKNCYSGDMGGSFSLISASMNDRSSVHRDNGAVNGGAIYC